MRFAHAWFVSVIAVSLTAPPLNAQQDLRETAVAMTLDALALQRFCEAPDSAAAARGIPEDLRQQVCGAGALGAVNAWMQGLSREMPTRQQLDSASARIDRIEHIVDSLSGEKGLPGALSVGGGLIGGGLAGGGALMSGGASGAGLSNVAWGLTDFVIGRAREELTVAALESLRSDLEDPTLKVLFPSSLVALRGVGDLNVSLIVPTLRTAFSQDLRQMPMQLASLPQASAFANTDARVLMSAAARMLAEYRRGSLSYQSVLRAIPADSSTWSTELRRALGVVRFALEEQAACAALTSPSAESCLVALTETPQALVAFTAFAERRGGALWGTGPLERQAKFRSVLAFTRDLESVMASLDGAAADSAQRRLQVPRAVLAFALDQAEAKDTALVRRLRAADEIAQSIARAAYDELALQMLTLIASEGLVDSTKAAKLRRALVFGSTLAQASTSAEVEQAIEAFADPVGSFRQRRRAGMSSIALVAYPGFSAGRERVTTAGGNADATMLGVSVPVGIERRWGGERGGIGAFVGFLDLGVLASYRLSGAAASDSVASDPNVEWSHIFAPSAMVTFAPWPKFPMIVGAGYQYAPQLRELTNSAQRVSAHRVHLLVAVDVTMLTFGRAWSR